ncbi:MAG: DUF5828 family protein [Halobacteriota archaeon]
MEATIAGFKVTGSWADIVEHGDRVTYALRDVGADRPAEVGEDLADAFHEWDDWRPKSDERMRKEVAEKTAEQASVEPGEGEKAGRGPDEDIKTAGEKLSESYEHLDEPAQAVDKWGESIDYVARAADTAGRKALRKVEDAVYRRVMTTVSPYYFDNELISANLDRKRGTDEPTYALQVNINDDGIKKAVRERLEAYERDYERWHVDAPTRTEIVEAAEGIELPEGDRDT